jgi:hypothetical protein
MASGRGLLKGLAVGTLGAAIVAACATNLRDEAAQAGKTPADFPETTVDYFTEVDGGVALSPEEAAGRNTWILWTGGNQAFWDYLANHSFGTLDLLKTADSRYRYRRFDYYGLMNDPDCTAARAPDAHGLWLDECPQPAGLDPEVYGSSAGVVGLRRFPNPNFDAAAEAAWDAERYYSDPEYYNNPELVRPYRLGMSCGFCHVGPHPLNPPADPNAPAWENMSATIGGQYFWIGRIFVAHPDESNFVWQLLNSSPPGALDTSFVASDNINAPRTINAVFNVGARLEVAEEEEIAGGALNLPGVEPVMNVPHILKDGSDSVGVGGALSRVYINIGTFHQEWVTHFKPLIGGDQTPMDVANARENSVYWRTTEGRVGNLAAYFLKAAGPMYLADAPGGARYLSDDPATLERGKLVFADNCASCHSSKRPDGLARGTDAYREWMRQEVLKPDFLDDNFLSDDARKPVSLVQTNACSALATNSTRGHIWDNFSSETYKTLPAVGTIQVTNPVDGTTGPYAMPGGGRGYHRTPSLVAMWATAPYFHNNALGRFTNDPSVAGRMAAFDDAVHKLLWPERRAETACQEEWGLPFCPPIYRTTAESYLRVPHQYVPDILNITDLTDEAGNVEIGPFPQGTPVSLLSNIDLSASKVDLARVLIKAKKQLEAAEGRPPEEQRRILRTLVPDLLSVNKCPDFVVDRGHYFGTDLSDADKEALIEFLKTV